MENLATLTIIVLVLSAGDAHLNIGSQSHNDYCVNILAGGLMPKTCLELTCYGFTTSGVYTIYPRGHSLYSFDVYCDQQTAGGGWTMFQKRMDGSVDFYRNWQNYKMGFGEVNGEHWLGNDKLSELLNLHTSELRVDLETVNNEKAYAEYSSFLVDGETAQYGLHVSGYSGTAGDSLARHNGHKFSTRDYDYDSYGPHSCAIRYHGAWWYNNCHHSNLNGDYLNGTHASYADGINWYNWKGTRESMKTSEMKFRERV